MSECVTKEAIEWRERKVEQVKSLGTHDDLFAASGGKKTPPTNRKWRR
jgi:hypothetical protein